MSKLVSFAGVSRVNGELKFRTANNVARITQLQKLGDTEVEMRFLGKEMTKSAAAKELLAMDYMGKDQACVDFFVQHAKDENPFKRSARVVKVTVPNQALVELAGAKVKVVNEHGTAKERREAKDGKAILDEAIAKLRGK